MNSFGIELLCILDKRLNCTKCFLGPSCWVAGLVGVVAIPITSSHLFLGAANSFLRPERKRVVMCRSRHRGFPLRRGHYHSQSFSWFPLGCADWLPRPWESLDHTTSTEKAGRRIHIWTRSFLKWSCVISVVAVNGNHQPIPGW